MKAKAINKIIPMFFVSVMTIGSALAAQTDFVGSIFGKDILASDSYVVGIKNNQIKSASSVYDQKGSFICAQLQTKRLSEFINMSEERRKYFDERVKKILYSTYVWKDDASALPNDKFQALEWPDDLYG